MSRLQRHQIKDIWKMTESNSVLQKPLLLCTQSATHVLINLTKMYVKTQTRSEISLRILST